jgi:hypothetical protein
MLPATSPAQTIQYAEKFTGADAGEKIARCIAALPPQGGVCDARELSGMQTAANGFAVGESGKPVQLMLGPVTLAVGGTIHVQRRSSIVGMPAAAGIGSDQSPSVIQAAGNSALSAVVQVDGALAVLQDLTVDGNKKAAPKGGVGILVSEANRAEMFRVTAQNAPAYGIEIYSTAANNESCCAKLQKVMTIYNSQAGLHLANTADVFISLSEFEMNGSFGIEINNSPTARIQHSDLGGNARDGIIVYGAGKSLQSNKQIIVGNQFGNNSRYDINVVGFDYDQKKHVSTGHLISSNGFIGSDRRPAGYAAIHVVDSGDNTIVGNTFTATSTHPYSSCVSISGDHELPDLVTGNNCTPSAAPARTAFVGTSNTQFGDNRGKVVPAPLPSPKP